MRENGRQFGKRLIAAQSRLRLLEALVLRDVAKDEHRHASA